ncbi:MAG: hypothetical protein AVDCRST_MAG53-2850, partial [uncultured Solirubrobacteraceae bacterium]
CRGGCRPPGSSAGHRRGSRSWRRCAISSAPAEDSPAAAPRPRYRRVMR